MVEEQTAADIVLTSVGRTEGSTSYAASMLWIAPRSFQECKRICGCFCSNTGRPLIKRQKDRFSEQRLLTGPGASLPPYRCTVALCVWAPRANSGESVLAAPKQV